MPIINEPVIIAYETQKEFDAIQTKNDNAIYFITDTLRIYVGNSEYYSTINAATKQYIDNAIGGITEMNYQVITELPANGVKGTIYLVAHLHGTNDTYDEYLWIGNKFEKIGNTDIDLSGYVPVVTGKTNQVPKFDADGTLTSTGYQLNKTVPSNAVFTDTTYDAATQNKSGLMSANDKVKLDGITISDYLKKSDIPVVTLNEYNALENKTAQYYMITDA